MVDLSDYVLGPLRGASIKGIEEAILTQKEIIASLESSHPDRAYLLKDEGVLWHARYERSGDANDIEQAIRAARDALQAWTVGGKGLGGTLSRLSLWLANRFQILGNPNDLDEAISTARRALELMSPGSEQWWDTYNNIAKTFQANFQSGHYGVEAVDKVISYHSEALDRARQDHKHSSGYLYLCCMLHHSRYLRSDSVQDLEQAISFGYEAIEMAHFAEVVGPEHLGLSAALLTHYQATHLSSSLEEGLRISRTWLASRGKDAIPRLRAQVLCGYGSMLEAKCHRMRTVDPAQAADLLYEATRCGGEAIDSLDPHDTNLKAFTLNMTCAWYSTLMDIRRDVGVGDDAAIIFSHALGLLPEGHPERARTLTNLMHLRDVQHQILTEQGQKLKAIAALDKAVTHAREALDATAEGDKYLGERRKHLGVLLLRKHLLTGEEDKGPADQESKKYLALAAATERASPLIRIPAAIQAGLGCWEDGELDKANQLLQSAVSLLPSLHSHPVSNRDLQQTLSQVSGLGAYAAALALEAGRPPFEALMSLEESRCIISGLSMRSRADTNGLADRDATLAAKYDDLRIQLAFVSKQLSLEGTYRHARAHQERLLRSLAETEAEIRRLPGWESFQLPMTEESVRKLAADGPLIVVNATLIRCDAIIVTTQEIKLVRLVDMTHKDLKKHVELFSHLGSESRRNAVPRKAKTTDSTPESALLWLWKAAVKPILDATDLTSSGRVWWLTTGIAGRAPFHAAGSHAVGSRENTLSRVVSSYTSSLKTLRFSRDKARRSTAATVPGRGMLLVTMSKNPPPHRDLDTQHEESAARDAFGPALEHLSQCDPEAVLERLPRYSVVHFACHGASIGRDPSQSGLLLARSGGTEPAMLSIASLEGVDIQDGAIAYLSACSTAEQVDGKLADEAIHLANWFQALGFRHVIGTMWGAEDAAAGEVARRFYTKVFPDGRTSGLDVATALHEALTDYISEGRHGVVAWGPFIHVGA
ncbi:hypothetical protein MFIFM68171_07356 [Madurella fahalii]|uniref:CHAT domain-containing protein n=1 Tax=Madurella fahalii TaxID=1157608 RepID=A0ABQ0GHB1_9PEZI